MSLVTNIDSNATGLRYAEEAGIGVLPTVLAERLWYPLEPNDYADFGGQVATVARNPINPTRQRKKGVATDLDASGGFSSDLTQTNIQRLMRGFFFADFREKPDTQAFSAEPTYLSTGAADAADTRITITNVDGTNEEYVTTDDFTDTATGAGGFLVNDLIFASGFTNTANNGLKVAVTVAALALEVAEDLVDEGPPTPDGRLVMVGHQFASADLSVAATSGFPTLTTSTKSFLDLGITPGEWIYIGGDGVTGFVTNASNNGFKRVRSVAQNLIVLDKSDQDMVTEASVNVIQMFLGRVIKNESDPDAIIRRSYQLERTLGFSDDSAPTSTQAEYLEGAHTNELTINVTTADKVTMDLAFVATDSTTINEFDTGTIKSDEGTSVALVEADAFNTSSDVTRVALTQLVDGEESPTPLFAFLEEFSLAINNNITPNKAIGVFGAFNVTAGSFIIDADATAYFADVAAVQAVRDTADVSLDFHFVKSNSGISFDMPLITLGDGRPTVAQDESIKIPLSNAGATGAKIDTTLDHTLLAVFWDYLPTVASA